MAPVAYQFFFEQGVDISYNLTLTDTRTFPV